MKKLTKQLMVGIAVVGFTVSGFAIPTILVSDGLGNSISIPDGGAATIVGSASAVTGGDVLLGTPGVVEFSGTVGAWILNVDTGTSKPFAGTTTRPNMDLSFVASGGVGTLSIQFSDDFFGPTTGNVLTSIGGTTPGSVTYKTLGSALNVEFAGVVLTSQGPFGPGAFSGTQGGPSYTTLGAPYALTQVIDVTHTAAGQNSTGNATLDVPDAGTTMMLLGSSLTALGLFGRSRKAAVKA
jgi:hypothetical protein